MNETPARFQIGDIVSLNVGDDTMPVATARIEAITFTGSKVLYDLALPFDNGEFYSVMQRVDSILVSTKY